jgi:rare lipoprotein A
MHALTAAHNRLPLGTVVKVTDLENKKTVVVTINDRGPFKRNRIIDLSYAAAQAISMIGPGSARVRVEVVTWGEEK